MKRLLLILITFISLSIKSQEIYILGFKEDKVKHFTCGYMIGFTSNCIAYEITKNKTIGLVSGIAFSTLAGHLKENYDRNNGKIYNKSDFNATLCGGISGSFTIRLVLWNSVYRKRVTMEQYWIIENE